MAQSIQDIPQTILDDALCWAVVMASGTVDSHQRRGFDRWLGQHPLHQVAWRRIQMIDDEFARVHEVGRGGVETLRRLDTRRRNKRRVVALGGLLPLLLLIGLLPALLLDGWPAQYRTGTAEQRRIELAGGASVLLNSNTSLDITQDVKGTVLQLHRGEILVDSGAALPADKPRVRTDQARFTPIGTRFVVQHREEQSELVVAVGRVYLQPRGGDGVQVKAGERWQVRDGKPQALSSSGLTPAAWAENIVEANNARLGDVLDTLGHYRHGWLHYDAAVAELRVTGVFRLNDTDSALLALETTLPVSVSRFGDWWVSLSIKKEK